MGYNYNLQNPDFNKMGYVIASPNLEEKPNRSALTEYHWKILKCRMIIFSNSSIMACPDKQENKHIHIIFNKINDDYDKLNVSFMKFSLIQNGGIRETTSDIFQMCFEYTMKAKIAPIWNILGSNYLINNRDFLSCDQPQHGVQYNITSNESVTSLYLKPVKINLMRSRDDYLPCEYIRVLPSLCKATIEDGCKSLPESSLFSSYKEIRRHWKNMHGYRLPEEESPYYLVRFWRGEPLTYPKICLLRNFPIITPILKSAEEAVLTKFFETLRCKFPYMLRETSIEHGDLSEV